MLIAALPSVDANAGPHEKLTRKPLNIEQCINDNFSTEKILPFSFVYDGKD